MIRAAILAFVLAACGDDSACPDQGVCDGQCAVMFTGNFEETSRSTASCPMLAGGVLDFAIISTTLHAELEISIDLGSAPTTGMDSPETVADWTAAVAANAADSDCEYSAGSMATPTGTFTLVLEALAPPHGSLDVLQFVQAAAGTPCGPGDTETVEVLF